MSQGSKCIILLHGLALTGQGITISETKDPFAPVSNPPANRAAQPAASTSFAPPVNGHPRSSQEQDNLLDRLKQMEEQARKADELASRPPTRPPWAQEHQSLAGPSKRPTWQSNADAETGWSKYSSLTTDDNSSPLRPQERLTANPNALQPLDPNSWLARSRSNESREMRPFGSSTFGSTSNKGKTITIDDDDDDDDVIELTNDGIPPGMRKSNKAPPVMVYDEDVKPNVGHRGSSQSSQMSGPSRSIGNGAGSSQGNGM
jgi:hypothetical protein